MLDTAVPPQKHKPRWTRRKDFRPKEILEAALKLFTERGFAATRLEDVAKQAGVTKGTLYLYFTNKEELFKAVMRESVFPAMAQAQDLVENYSGPSVNLMISLIKYYWSQVSTTKLGSILKLIIAESGNFPELAQFYMNEFVLPSRKLAARALQRGIDSGELRACDPEFITRMIAAPVMMEAVWEYSLRRYEPHPVNQEAFLNAHIDLILHGICKNPKS